MFPRISLVLAMVLVPGCTGDGNADSSSVSGITTSGGTETSTSESTTATATETSGTDTETSTSGPTSTSTTTTGGEDECSASSECTEGNVCAANYGNAKGPNMCVPECVENLDDSRWCVDDDACCNAGAECTAVGLCTGGSGGSTSTSTSTGG